MSSTKVWRFTNVLGMIEIELTGDQAQLRIVPHDDRLPVRIAPAASMEDALNQVFISGEMNALPLQCAFMFTRDNEEG